MFGLTAKTEVNFKPLEKAVEKSTFRNLSHAAAAIRATAIGEIGESPEASAPGTPPHTRAGSVKVSKKGKRYGRKNTLPGAIKFAVEKDHAFIGPVFSQIGTSGEAHEFGGEYKGQTYPERRFMQPALEANQARFARGFAGSIGES